MLHKGHSRRDLDLWKIVPKAKDWGEARGHDTGKLSADNVAALGVIPTALRMPNDDGRGDPNQVICGEFSGKRPRSCERRILSRDVDTSAWEFAAQEGGNWNKSERTRGQQDTEGGLIRDRSE